MRNKILTGMMAMLLIILSAQVSARYLEPDPLGLLADNQNNNYVYVANNPINYTDSTGLIRDGDEYWGMPQEFQSDYRQYKAENSDPCGCVAKFLGVGAVAGATIASGMPIIPKDMVMPGSANGTSPAGKAADALFGDKKFTRASFPKGVRTIGGGPFTGQKWRWTRTRSVARFSARWVPYFGWGLLASDAGLMIDCWSKCEEDDMCSE